MRKKGTLVNTQPVYEPSEKQLQGFFGGNKPSLEISRGSFKEKSDYTSLDAAHKAYKDMFQNKGNEFLAKAQKRSGNAAENTAHIGMTYIQYAAYLEAKKLK
jgi:hypothetical protein